MCPQADKVDAYLHSLLIKTEPNRSHLACLGTWVLYHTLQTMINYTLAGFELELYAPYEYHYVYWYLSELLFAWLVSTLHRADNFLLEHETLSGTLSSGALSMKSCVGDALPPLCLPASLSFLICDAVQMSVETGNMFFWYFFGLGTAL